VDVIVISSLLSTSTTSSLPLSLSRSPHRLLSQDNIAAAIIIASAGLRQFCHHCPHPPSSLRTPRTRPFACRHLLTPRRSRCCHLLLAVIVVTIAPPPSLARQHCSRRHHCLLLLPAPTLIALSTARFRCSQRDDIDVAVIAATSTSLPNDNVQRRDRRNGRRDGGNGHPLSQPPH
jgi:hypothetical protein